MSKSVWQVIQAIDYSQSIVDIEKATFTDLFNKYLHIGDIVCGRNYESTQICKHCKYKVHFKTTFFKDTYRAKVQAYYITKLVISGPMIETIEASYKINDSWVGDVNVRPDGILSHCSKFAAFT